MRSNKKFLFSLQFKKHPLHTSLLEKKITFYFIFKNRVGRERKRFSPFGPKPNTCLMTLAFIDFRAQFFRAFYLVFRNPPPPLNTPLPILIFISIISLELQWCHLFFLSPNFAIFFPSVIFFPPSRSLFPHLSESEHLFCRSIQTSRPSDKWHLRFFIVGYIFFLCLFLSLAVYPVFFIRLAKKLR